MYGITGWQVLINLLMLLLAVQFSRQALKTPYIIKPKQKIMSIILILFIYLFSFYALDYLGYMIMVENYSSHFEDIYLDIIDMVSGDYLLFRLIVFGSAYLLTLFAFKRLDKEFDLTFLVFVMTSVTVLAYGRFTLALALSFWGYSFIVKTFRPRILSIAMGIALMIFSLRFHNSVLILMPLYAASLLLRNINRTTVSFVILIVIATAILYSLFGESILSSITSSESLEEYEANRAVGTGGGGILSGIGMGELIHRLLQYSPYYLSFILYFIVVAKHDFRNWSISIRLVSSLFAVIMIMATLLSIRVGSMNTNLLFYRTLYYSSLAMCLFLSYCYKNNIRQKFVKTIIIIAFVSQVYEISYYSYLAFLGLLKF